MGFGFYSGSEFLSLWRLKTEPWLVGFGVDSSDKGM